jgi:hypothetical protein
MSVMQVLHRAAYLYHEPPDLGEGKVFPSFEHVRQRAVGAQFQHDVGARPEGEGAVEGDDVRVRQLGVDLELRDELSCPSAITLPFLCNEDMVYLLRQLRGLHFRLHNLERDHLAGWATAIISFGAVADGEAAFAQGRAGRIVDAAGLGDNGRRRLGVDGRHAASSSPLLLWLVVRRGRRAQMPVICGSLSVGDAGEGFGSKRWHARRINKADCAGQPSQMPAFLRWSSQPFMRPRKFTHAILS